MSARDEVWEARNTLESAVTRDIRPMDWQVTEMVDVLVSAVRAAALREAADVADAESDAFAEHVEMGESHGAGRVADLLRRMATEGEAKP